jgi:hypothetical protein
VPGKSYTSLRLAINRNMKGSLVKTRLLSLPLKSTKKCSAEVKDFD